MNGLHRRGGKDGEGPRAKLGRLGGAHGLFGAAAAALLLAAWVSVLTDRARASLGELEARQGRLEGELAGLQKQWAGVDDRVAAGERGLEEDRQRLAEAAERLETQKKLKCSLGQLRQTAKDRRAKDTKALGGETAREVAELEAGLQERLRKQRREEGDLKVEIEAMKRRKVRLWDTIREAEGNYRLGKALRQNDPGYIETFITRVTLKTDSYLGSYILNQESVPASGEEINLPRWDGQHEVLGVMDQEIFSVIPKSDPFLKPRRVVWDRCALVGNSGISMFYKNGKRIDEHDAVIRFNIGPTKGFEDFVGRKTTVRFVNRLHFGFQEYPSEIVMQQVTTKEVMETFLDFRKELPGSRVFMVSPEFHQHVNGDLRKPATNGFYGILFALQRCKAVTIYGIYRGEFDEVPYHYFDAEEPRERQRSRDLEEGPMILELARRSNGRMTVAEPCIQLDDYINGCKTCPPGSACAKAHSFPVPLAGHCMKEGAPYCFFRCVRPEDCPGGKEHAVCGAGVETDGECAGAGAPGR